MFASRLLLSAAIASLCCSAAAAKSREAATKACGPGQGMGNYWYATQHGTRFTGQGGCDSAYKGCSNALTGTFEKREGGRIYVNWDLFGEHSFPESYLKDSCPTG